MATATVTVSGVTAVLNSAGTKPYRVEQTGGPSGAFGVVDGTNNPVEVNINGETLPKVWSKTEASLAQLNAIVAAANV